MLSKPPRLSPLITRAFRKTARADWSDGKPLFAAQAAELAHACAWPADSEPCLPQSAATQQAIAREAQICAMRAAGVSLRDIRDALNYASVSSVANAQRRAQRREGTP